MSSLALRTAERGPEFYDAWLKRVPDLLVQGIESSWRLWARSGQRPPPGDWHGWLMMAGRGFGKTRAAAEWVHGLAMAGDGETRIALVGANPDEARAVMIEGESGLLRVGLVQERPRFEPSLGRLIWSTGAQARLFSGANPDGLRGSQHHFAWCDEIAKWAQPQATWDNLRLGLRLGDAPRAIVTTTPRPIALLKTLMAARGVVVTYGSTFDNAVLPDAFVDGVTQAYGGTRLGTQELEGAMVDDVEDALWRRDLIQACRVAEVPPLVRVVVGVDPPASARGDACGIVAVGLGKDGHGYVLEDASVERPAPERWAAAVALCGERHGADRVVAEANNGGDMVKSVLRAADGALPVKLVHASRGKATRAEPIAVLYESGRVHHADAFPALEDEMCGMVRGGGYEGPGRSPDRADALVWALSDLMMRRQSQPRVTTL